MFANLIPKHNLADIMNRFYLLLLTVFCGSLIFTSCSDSEAYNPYEEQNRGDFFPSSIIIRKNTETRETTETWSNIVRNSKGKITAYDYTLEISGDISQKEERSYTLEYYTKHNGTEAIETNFDVKYSKSSGGISEEYTRNIQEIVTINSNGYIDRIDSRIKHWSHNAKEPITTTAERTFAYSGDFCKSSSYKDNEYQISYKYNWSGYQLKNITELKESLKDGSIEYNTFDYGFDDAEIYPYTGTNLMAFAQSCMPQIYASMGYIGNGTPYIMTEEVLGGYTKFGNITSDNIKIRNTYSFDGDVNYKVAYNAFSNIYDTYSITFCK